MIAYSVARVCKSSTEVDDTNLATKLIYRDPGAEKKQKIRKKKTKGEDTAQNQLSGELSIDPSSFCKCSRSLLC